MTDFEGVGETSPLRLLETEMQGLFDLMFFAIGAATIWLFFARL